MAVIEAIATTYLEADAASVTFSSIPATYEHLQLRISAHITEASDVEYFYMRFNDDTATNYSSHFMKGEASTAGAQANTGQNYIFSRYFPANSVAGSAPHYGVMVMDIFDYANTNKNTTVQWTTGFNLSATVTGVRFCSGLWDSTAAVDEIYLAPDNTIPPDFDWTRGSEFTLYGLNSS